MLEHETFYEYLRIIIKLIWEEEEGAALFIVPAPVS